MMTAACTKDIPYNGEGADPMMVLNCLVSDGSHISVDLSRSMYFLENETGTNIPDATVSVTINGVSGKAIYNPGTNKYEYNRSVKALDVLQVKAVHPTYGTVWATDTVPEVMKAEDIDYNCNTMAYNSSDDDDVYVVADSVCRVSLFIDHDKERPRYYRMNIWVNSYYDQGGYTSEYYEYYEIPYTTLSVIRKEDDILDNLDAGLESEVFWGPESFTFCDNGIVGSLDIDVYMSKIQSNSIYTGTGGEEYEMILASEYILTLEFVEYSPAFYNYLQSTDSYDGTDFSLFTEPVTIYNNINGGLGILGSRSTTTTKRIHIKP